MIRNFYKSNRLTKEKNYPLIKDKTKINFLKKKMIALEKNEVIVSTLTKFNGDSLNIENITNFSNPPFEHNKSVGFLIHKKYITPCEDYYYFNDLKKYENRFNVSPNRKDDSFVGEWSFDCIGTGIVITSRHILTPLHVVKSTIIDDLTLSNYVFIIDCQIDEVNKNKILGDKIIKLEKIILKPNFLNKNEINDICIIRTSEEINKDRIAKICLNDFKKFEYKNLYALGYPLGLAMKKSIGKRTFHTKSDENFFYAFLNTYEKNSGSPVFMDKKKGFVGLILEAGFGEDFIEDEENKGFKKKLRYSIAKNDFEGGTKVLKIEKIINRISQLINNPLHSNLSKLDNYLINLFTNQIQIL